MLVGHELGYAVERRPIGSINGISASEGSFESTGHGKVPVESCRLLKGCVVIRAAAAGVFRRSLGSPTERLWPVPTMPTQSQAILGLVLPAPPPPAVPPLPAPALPPAPVGPVPAAPPDFELEEQPAA